MSIWDRFEGMASAEEVKNARDSFKPLPVGEYDMKLEEITASESQKGLPMIKGKFRTVEGNRVVFYNQNLMNMEKPELTEKNIAEGVEFISKLMGEEYEFTTLTALSEAIGAIVIGEVYKIRVSYGKNDTAQKYAKLTIIPPVFIDESDAPFDV